MFNEEIKFEIAFKTVWWRDPPKAAVYIDDCEKFNSTVPDNLIVRFAHTLNFTDHELSIVRTGKDNSQVRLTEQGYQGQDLIIDWIKIDGVNIRDLIWTNSVYQPEYPEPWASQERLSGVQLEQYVQGETHLGHNGTWRLKFSSPFYRFFMDWMG